jgi:hypothetical protein
MIVSKFPSVGKSAVVGQSSRIIPIPMTPTYRLSSRAVYDFNRRRNITTNALKRYKMGGERLKLTRMVSRLDCWSIIG